MRYPYNQVTASIGFGCDKADEWVYVAFSEVPNVSNVESEDEVNLFNSQMTFDNQTNEYATTQKFGARFLHFKADQLITTNIIESSSMTFAINWHQEGIVRFDFTLEGSAEAIGNAREKCANP